MIKKLMLVMLLPSLIFGALINEYYHPLSWFNFEVSCVVNDEDDTPEYSCTVDDFNRVDNDRNYRRLFNSEISQAIYLAGELPIIHISNQNISNKSCAYISENIGNIMNSEGLVYSDSRFSIEIVANYGQFINTTPINGILCTYIDAKPFDRGKTILLKIPDNYMPMYNDMLSKADKTLSFIKILKFVIPIIPFIFLYLIAFLGLAIFYYVKLSYRYIKGTKKS